MIIRKAQLEPAAKAAAAAFEQEMVDHLFSFSPKHCEVIKEPGVREVIRLGLQRAEAFGFTFRGPVRLFIELMFMFGSEFATDPQHPWAAAALQDKTVPDQMSRANLLYDAAQKYLEEVSGPNHRYAVASLRRTRAQINQASGRKLDMPPRELDHAITSALREIYPEKAAYLKDDGLQRIADLGAASASEHGISQPRGRALLVFLVFALGHGAADDPLYPWVRNALVDPLPATPDDRAARLESKAILYLDRVIGYTRGV